MSAMSPGQLDVGGGDAGDDLLDGQAAVRKLFTVEDDMELHLVAAVDTDFADARNAGELLGQCFVRVIVKFVNGMRSRQKYGDDRDGVDVDFAQCRRFDAAWEVFNDRVDFLADFMDHDIDIRSEHEFQRDGGGVLHADAGGVLQTVDGGDRVFNSFDNIDFHLFWGGSRIDGRDDDVRDVEFRHGVDADAPVHLDAEEDQHEQKRAHGDFSFD